MHILIAIQDLSNEENVQQIEKLLQFAAQFTHGTDEHPTIQVNIESGVDCLPPHVDTMLAEACIRASIIAFRPQIRFGDPVKNILLEANSGNYDLLIVRDRPNHRLVRFFRAKSAVRIAKCAHCPVIVVKGNIGPIQHILMCDSGSPDSPMLGYFITRVVDMLPGKQDTTILHVMSQISAGPGVQGEQLRADAEELIEIHTPEGEILERDIHSLEKSGLHTFPKVRHGLVVDEILAESRSGNYDLITIGEHHNQWQHFLLDDLSRQIIEQADRPVLIVK